MLLKKDIDNFSHLSADALSVEWGPASLHFLDVTAYDMITHSLKQ